ncbi:MAG: two-component system response regulator, partial [Deltaproteobacteria bacterium]
MTKILLADDSAFMRKILTNILAKAGYTDIIEAEDGEETV